MAKRDDDGYDLIDPFKFMIGCCKFMFGLIKMLLSLVKTLYSGLTSPDYFVRAVTIVFILLIVFAIGSWIYIQNFGMLK